MTPGKAPLTAATASPQALLQAGREVLVQQPFSVLVGAEIAALSQCAG